MCELLGLAFERPISADFSISAFAPRSEENADGWGLAWYPDQASAIVKEPKRWDSSEIAGFLKDYSHLRSSFYIGHVRHRTTGGTPTHADTHPFVRERGGRDLVFAHNGTLEGHFWDLPLGLARPLGRTDSERAFCILLDRLDRRGGTFDDSDSWSWLFEQLRDLNQFGRLNVLLSDGRRLFAYRDWNGWKGLTRRRVVLHPDRPRHFSDRTMAVDLVDQDGGEPDVGHVIATTPLGGDGWESIEPGIMMVFQGSRAMTVGIDF
ncbi:MAG: class II glutamine amidotransferase [Isosphaeraceae bacterium]